MARPAPAAERTVAVLSFLADHPDEAFSLSELARHLSLNKATTHALTATLADAGWLLRHPADKTYRLGPALIALGRAAQAGFPALDFARGEMRALVDDLGTECLATGAVGEEIVVLARAGTPAPLGINVQEGQRLPLAPPFGTVFMAWAGAEEIDRWLRRHGPSARAEDLARYRSALEAVRRRGYTVALEASSLGAVLAGRGDALDRLGHEEYMLAELEGATSYRINHLSAPVFGPDGGLALVLTLFGFRGPLTAEQVPELAARLLRSTRTVTSAVHGRESPELA